ncbi:MAG: hypothetical protein KAX84_11480 [Burkholderiales bacterium]|nr:hypothetical protein [Burkholderiales bacterium]
MKGSCVIRRGTAALTYFALVFAAGFVMGAVRVPFLVPRLGVRVAELLVVIAVMPLMVGAPNAPGRGA